MRGSPSYRNKNINLSILWLVEWWIWGDVGIMRNIVKIVLGRSWNSTGQSDHDRAQQLAVLPSKSMKQSWWFTPNSSPLTLYNSHIQATHFNSALKPKLQKATLNLDKDPAKLNKHKQIMWSPNPRPSKFHSFSARTMDESPWVHDAPAIPAKRKSCPVASSWNLDFPKTFFPTFFSDFFFDATTNQGTACRHRLGEARGPQETCWAKNDCF